MLLSLQSLPSPEERALVESLAATAKLHSINKTTSNPVHLQLIFSVKLALADR